MGIKNLLGKKILKEECRSTGPGRGPGHIWGAMSMTILTLSLALLIFTEAKQAEVHVVQLSSRCDIRMQLLEWSHMDYLHCSPGPGGLFVEASIYRAFADACLLRAILWVFLGNCAFLNLSSGKPCRIPMGDQHCLLMPFGSRFRHCPQGSERTNIARSHLFACFIHSF